MLTSSTPSSNVNGIEDGILCYYVNSTAEVQVLRIANVASFYYEKVVFPMERLLFDAPRLGLVEVFTQATTPCETVPCVQLQVQQPTGNPA